MRLTHGRATWPSAEVFAVCSSATVWLKAATHQPDFGSQRPSEAVRGRQRQSGIRGALLRLVCPAPSSLYGKCSHLPRPIHSDWLFSLANQCMRSEAEVRDQNKRLRRHTQTVHLFHFHLTRTQEFLFYVYMFSIDERE